MEKVILIKGNVKRPFSAVAAKIAVEHLGWSEFTPPSKPSEVLTRTKPPKILKPVPLIEAEHPGKQLSDSESSGITEKVGDDITRKVEVIEEVIAKTDDIAVKAEVKQTDEVKKTRKSPVRSKSAKK